MHPLQEPYGILPGVAAFVADGFLKVVSEDPDRKTVAFQISSLQRKDGVERIRTFSLVWIHPDFNAQFCHYYESAPGDMANFYVTEDDTDVGDADLDLHSVEELTAWLKKMKADSEHCRGLT